MIEDDLNGHRPALRLRWNVVFGGLRERAYASGIAGGSTSPGERSRAGIVLVLAGWAAFIFAGAGFSKVSEHFAGAIAAPSRAIPQTAFDLLQWMAVAAGGCTLIALAVVLPSFWRYIRGGGWTNVRTPVRRATGVSIVVVIGVGGLARWAHLLTVAERNGADAAYTAAFVIWAALVAVTIALWSRAAGTALRRLELSRRALAAVSALAVTVGGAMVAMTVEAAVWWGQIAIHAPWFLHGTKFGSGGSAFDATLAGAVTLMLLGATVGLYGVSRIVRSQIEIARASG